MPDTTERQHVPRVRGATWKRLGWFIALYFAGLVVVGLVAAALRLLMDLTVL